MITEIEFTQLKAQGFNRIPLMLQAFADLETPLSLYLKLTQSANTINTNNYKHNSNLGNQYTGYNSFLLESVVGGERFGRYSFIGLPARTLLRTSGFGSEAKTEVISDGVE